MSILIFMGAASLAGGIEETYYKANEYRKNMAFKRYLRARRKH